MIQEAEQIRIKREAEKETQEDDNESDTPTESNTCSVQ